jgi:hypothetical protein
MHSQGYLLTESRARPRPRGTPPLCQCSRMLQRRVSWKMFENCASSSQICISVLSQAGNCANAINTICNMAGGRSVSDIQRPSDFLI